MTKQTTTLFAFALVAGLLLAACQPNGQSTASPSPEVATSPAASPVASPDASPTSTMINEADVPEGSTLLTTETTYQTPGGVEQVAFSLVVDGEGVITDAGAEVLGKTPTTIMRQTSFAQEMPTALKGMKIAELTEVDRIGGSSLTTAAFNKSLEELKAQL